MRFYGSQKTSAEHRCIEKAQERSLKQPYVPQDSWSSGPTVTEALPVPGVPELIPFEPRTRQCHTPELLGLLIHCFVPPLTKLTAPFPFPHQFRDFYVYLGKVCLL